MGFSIFVVICLKFLVASSFEKKMVDFVTVPCSTRTANVAIDSPTGPMGYVFSQVTCLRHDDYIMTSCGFRESISISVPYASGSFINNGTVCQADYYEPGTRRLTEEELDDAVYPLAVARCCRFPKDSFDYIRTVTGSKAFISVAGCNQYEREELIGCTAHFEDLQNSYILKGSQVGTVNFDTPEDTLTSQKIINPTNNACFAYDNPATQTVKASAQCIKISRNYKLHCREEAVFGTDPSAGCSLPNAFITGCTALIVEGDTLARISSNAISKLCSAKSTSEGAVIRLGLICCRLRKGTGSYVVE